MTYQIQNIGGHVAPRAYPGLLLDWRSREVRPQVYDWFGLVAYAQAEILNPMVPFELTCRWLPSADIRPVSAETAWMPMSEMT